MFHKFWAKNRVIFLKMNLNRKVLFHSLKAIKISSREKKIINKLSTLR